MTQQARLNVRLEKQLLTEARIKAIRDGSNISHIVRDFLTHYVQTSHNTASAAQEEEARTRIAAAAGRDALPTMSGPVAHNIGYFVWHFTAGHRKGRVRCQFRNHITGAPIPDKWTLYWIDDPLNPQPLQEQQK